MRGALSAAHQKSVAALLISIDSYRSSTQSPFILSLSSAASTPITMPYSIDYVTVSFVASLALAGKDVLDVSRRSRAAQRRNTQSYLLAKPLISKRVDLADLQQTFKRIWTLNGKFKVQARPAGLFLFSFDLKRDQNRVLWGGPWYYLRMPMIVQEYDGLMDFDEIDMNRIFFWVRIEKIPLKLEVPKTIEDAAIAVGDNPFVDLSLGGGTPSSAPDRGERRDVHTLSLVQTSASYRFRVYTHTHNADQVRTFLP
ncbi:hypothetical protein ACLB2K_044162 [Fragaria x ananassa]